MKHVGLIAALIILTLAAILVHAELSTMDTERQEWRTEQDSLVRGWNATVEELTALQAHTDSLRAYTDSVKKQMPPPEKVREKALKTFEYAPLGMAVDTLSHE